MEAAPQYLQSPETLRGFFFVNNVGQQVPLTAFARITTTNTPLSVNHERGTPASTISFSLAPGVSLSQAADAVNNAVAELGVPVGIRAASAARRGRSSPPGGAAAAHPGGHHHHLPGAGHPVRKPGAPHHHPLHTALRRVGRCWR